MAEHATERTTIDAPIARCFEVATTFEAYPEWASGIELATVVEGPGDGGDEMVDFVASGLGRRVEYRLRYERDEPTRLAWQLVAGDALRRLEGSYEFAPVPDDPASTEVTFSLTVELAVPLSGFVRRRAESRILQNALPDLRARAEATA